MKVHLIVNPVAGRGGAVELCEETATILRASGATVTTYVTKASGDASTHVKSLRCVTTDRPERLIVVGGDGTVAEVINGGGPSPGWALGVIPLGTANLVAREIGMPLTRDPKAWASSIANATPWAVDLMKIASDGIEPRLALATVSAGADGAVVHAVSESRRSRSGSGGYTRWIQPTLRTLREIKFPRLVVTLDSHRTVSCSACIIQKSRTYGGMFHFTPNASLDSGELHVVVLQTRSARDVPRYLLGGLFKRLGRFRDVRRYRCQHVQVTHDFPVAIQADGDPAGHTELDVRLLPSAMTLLRVS